MEQLRFFEVEKEDWDFLKEFGRLKKEHREFIEIHAMYSYFEKSFLKDLSKLKLNETVIDFNDIKAKYELKNRLKTTQTELKAVTELIEDIETWLEYETKRARSIN